MVCFSRIVNGTLVNPQPTHFMKRTNMKLATLMTSVFVLSLLVACSKETPRGEKTTMSATQEGVPGGVFVETYKVTATVTGVDSKTRKVTLTTPDGDKTVFKAGPEVVNFDQIRVGDKVHVTAVDQLVVFLRKSGAPQGDGRVTTVALAPKGAKPGVLMADTIEVTAKVTSIDLAHHKATLLFPNGKSKTFTARKDVDLSKVSIGEEVVIRTTEAIAITVEKP